MQLKVDIKHLSTHRSVILYYYNLGHRCAAEIARQTKNRAYPVRYNLAKITKKSEVEHRCGNGGPPRITPTDN